MLILYTRGGCCLCQAAEARLRGLPHKLRDVDANPVWQARYTFRVPVLVRAEGEREVVLLEGDFGVAPLPGG